MKINVEIEMEDLISDMIEDESCDINEALKGEVIRQSIRKLLPVIQKRVDEQIFSRVDEIVKSKIDKSIERALSAAIDAGKIKRGGGEVSIADHVRDLFERSSGWNNPSKQLEKIASDFGKELKDKYNAIFAMKIVSNMGEQGMLKDDMAKLLTKED